MPSKKKNNTEVNVDEVLVETEKEEIKYTILQYCQGVSEDDIMCMIDGLKNNEYLIEHIIDNIDDSGSYYSNHYHMNIRYKNLDLTFSISEESLFMLIANRLFFKIKFPRKLHIEQSPNEYTKEYPDRPCYHKLKTPGKFIKQYLLDKSIVTEFNNKHEKFEYYLDGKTCSICMEVIKWGEKKKLCTNGHEAHYSCYYPIRRKNKCPMCRNNIIDTDSDDE